MSVFLTPEGRPFYGGTYFPDQPRHGMPSFRQVLDGVGRAWRDQRGELEAAGANLVATLVEQQRAETAADAPTTSTLAAADQALTGSLRRAQRHRGAARPSSPSR